MDVIVFCAGNVTRSEATSLLQNVERTLSAGSLLNIRGPCFSQLPERRIMCLEAGSEWLYPTAGFNPDDENSAVGIFFQVPWVNEERDFFLLSVHVILPSMYNLVRLVLNDIISAGWKRLCKVKCVAWAFHFNSQGATLQPTSYGGATWLFRRPLWEVSKSEFPILSGFWVQKWLHSFKFICGPSYSSSDLHMYTENDRNGMVL